MAAIQPGAVTVPADVIVEVLAALDAANVIAGDTLIPEGRSCYELAIDQLTGNAFVKLFEAAFGELWADDDVELTPMHELVNDRGAEVREATVAEAQAALFRDMSPEERSAHLEKLDAEVEEAEARLAAIEEAREQRARTDEEWIDFLADHPELSGNDEADDAS